METDVRAVAEACGTLPANVVIISARTSFLMVSPRVLRPELLPERAFVRGIDGRRGNP
jgi:hypothetical protein